MYRKMAAVATFRNQTARDIQLSLPANYEMYYKEKYGTYKPLIGSYSANPPKQGYIFDDERQQLHSKFRDEANNLVLAGVQSRRDSEKRYLTTPHGQGTRRPLELSQRKVANISYGNFGSFYDRSQDVEGSVIGGVIRTKQGRNYIEELLKKRIDSLNRIQEARGNFAYGSTNAPPEPNVGSEEAVTANVGIANVENNPLVEMNLILQRILDSVGLGLPPEANFQHYENPTEAQKKRAAKEQKKYDSGRLFEAEQAFKDLSSIRGSTTDLTFKFIQLLFRYGPKMNFDELENINSTSQQIFQELNGLLDPDEVSRYEGIPSPHIQIALTIQTLFSRVLTYLQRMIEGVNMSTKDRQSLSKTLVKSLNFDRSLKNAERNPLISKAVQDVNDALRGVKFSAPPRRREDTQQRVARGDRSGFTPDVRDQMNFSQLIAPHEGPMQAAQAVEHAPQEGEEGLDEDAEDQEGSGLLRHARRQVVKRIGKRTNVSGRNLKSHYNKDIGGWDVEIM